MLKKQVIKKNRGAVLNAGNVGEIFNKVNRTLKGKPSKADLQDKIVDLEDKIIELNNKNQDLELRAFNAETFGQIGDDKLEKACQRIDKYILIIKELKEKYVKNESNKKS